MSSEKKFDLYDYIDNYGIYSFDEEKFNEVDAVIFTYLSYVNFENVLGKKKTTLCKAARTHQGLHKIDEANVLAVHDAVGLLYYIRDLKRYRNCILYNYKYEADDNIQFGVLTIEYQKDKIFISFEGTNERISGWKENLMLSYNFPTRSHIKVIDYMNRNFIFSTKKIIVGGHSKGGNFALVAGMYSNYLVRKKIVHIYNIDGPGLLSKQFNSRRFQSIVAKYTHIIPENSIIGILLYSTNYGVIKTNTTGPLAHHIFYWKIKDNHFIGEKLSNFSENLQARIIEYIEKTDDKELEIIVNDFSKICALANVNSLLEIKSNYNKIFELIEASKELDEKTEKSLYELLDIIIKSYKDSKYSEFKNFLNKLKG